MKKIVFSLFSLGALSIAQAQDGRGTDRYHSLAQDSSDKVLDNLAEQANTPSEAAPTRPSGNPDIGTELREDSMKYAIERANNRAAMAEAEATNSIEKSRLVEDNSKLTLEIAVGLIVATALVIGAYLMGRRSKV